MNERLRMSVELKEGGRLSKLLTDAFFRWLATLPAEHLVYVTRLTISGFVIALVDVTLAHSVVNGEDVELQVASEAHPAESPTLSPAIQAAKEDCASSVQAAVEEAFIEIGLLERE